ncbi:response regulator [Paenibacillus doosanensis]|uniref:Transcriptional regulatory protein YehT n=1 Tax=Paenibacillus konkukensis TaxID=2020716 RepID=A0ABY4RN57_9BACL|nr:MULTISPECIES: response regulator [Paenibacillus]MCS7462951.1 response regulator [Paenibacillus doosanensis]UQZ83856.1 Transcriptional regulatory protein YehT [Paenibacillus konkukensis]
MRAILIDDEKLALLHLERMLQMDGRVQVDGKYTSARAGLEQLAKEPPDIVFLDIGMPGINGLKAAELIQQIDERIRIVYITAYSEYALNAFELHALDYLLKPVTPERLHKTVERIEAYLSLRSGKKEEAKEEPAILCFKRLDSTHFQSKLQFRTLRAQELFAFLLHQHGQWVSKELILDTVWPQYTQDKALTHLHTAVYQIRKQLKEWDAEASIKYAHDSYCLVKARLTTDVELFERCLTEKAADEERQMRLNEQAFALYRGDYLEEHDYAWAKPRRRELLQRYIRLVYRMAEHDMGNGRELQAIERLCAAQEKEPYSEDICRLILAAYGQLKDADGLRRYYEAFAQFLMSELGTEPEEQTAELYTKLQRGLSSLPAGE